MYMMIQAKIGVERYDWIGKKITKKNACITVNLISLPPWGSSLEECSIVGHFDCLRPYLSSLNGLFYTANWCSV